MAVTGRYPVTQKYLMTRNQALNFPISFFQGNFKKNDVFGMVIDIPMPNNILTTMVCFINGAANLYFNNGNEYTGASQKYRTLVQAAHNLVANAGILLPKCEKTTRFDLPQGRTQNITNYNFYGNQPIRVYQDPAAARKDKAVTATALAVVGGCFLLFICLLVIAVGISSSSPRHSGSQYAASSETYFD